MHPIKYKKTKPGVDLIGDTHGYFDETMQLLNVLGYGITQGKLQHYSGERFPQFLGDTFDRGNKIVEIESFQIEQEEKGCLKNIMGNHEYNLECMYIPHPNGEGFLRPHVAKNMDNTRATRQQYAALDDDGELLAAHRKHIYELPVYQQNAEYRIVHACWDPKNIALLDAHLKDGRLTREQMIATETAWKKNPLSTAIVETLKGKEIDTAILLKHGFSKAELEHQNKTKRVAWWYENRDDALVPAGDVILDLPKELRKKEIPLELVREQLIDDPDPRPVFFGHYCLRQPPKRTGSKYQCLDFGVIKTKGCLTAYRWNFGDKGLKEERLVSVPRVTPKPVLQPDF